MREYYNNWHHREIGPLRGEWASKDPNKQKFYPSKYPARRKYLPEEDVQILMYIIENDAFDHVKGKSLWMKMATNGVSGKHTWQSLKDHFRRKIVPQIHDYVEAYELDSSIVDRIESLYE